HAEELPGVPASHRRRPGGRGGPGDRARNPRRAAGDPEGHGPNRGPEDRDPVPGLGTKKGARGQAACPVRSARLLLLLGGLLLPGLLRRFPGLLGGLLRALGRLPRGLLGALLGGLLRLPSRLLRGLLRRRLLGLLGGLPGLLAGRG